MGESLHPTRYPTNLYRDDEFKTVIQAWGHSQVQAACGGKKGSMAPVNGGGSVGQGVVGGCAEWSIKEGNTKVVSLGGGKKAAAASGAAKVKGKKPAAKKAAAKAGSKSAGKSSRPGKKSVGSRPTATPQGGKKTKGSTNQMTVSQYRKYLESIKGKKK